MSSPPNPPRPVSTYRVQLTPDFGFAQVAQIAGYLRDLGVSHVYLSPILQSTPESQHGYDVTDHSRIREEFGGATGFREMAQQLAAQDLGIVVDIVPNHMNTVNAQFWSVLKDGPASPYASWFDIDWVDGKVALPVLGDDTPPVVDGDVLRYHEHAFPHPGHYRLVDWREGPGYRRFFDVSSLIGLRVEDPSVLFATHEVIFWLLDEGLVDGLRVDHPDGLADPRGYLERLRARAGSAWTVVEKILIGPERLPGDWACDGTTGYDVLNRVNGLFVDPAGKQPLIRLFTELTGQPAEYRPVMAQAKQEVLDLFFGAEVDRLAKSTSCDPAAVRELLAAMPVYRAYVVPGEPPPPSSVETVELAAASCSPAVRPLVQEVLYGSADAIVRFQQSCGPVMAKGVEDTALYRWFPLACLNEVGGEPDVFGVPVEEFHEFCAQMPPYTMTTLSTHDTKRSEDVRARLSVLSEMPGEWAAAVAEWSAQVSFDPHLDYLAWQNVMAAWPISAERLTDYLLKAAREAKTAISWVNPDPGYERRLRAFAEAAVRLPIGGFTERVDPYAMCNSLGAKLVQLMMPGVPDVYQGNETTDFSLVDPDNRRPVTYPRKPETSWDSAKLLVTTQALRLRRRLGGAAAYLPLYAEGERADHVIAFARAATDIPLPETAEAWAGTAPEGDVWGRGEADGGLGARGASEGDGQVRGEVNDGFGARAAGGDGRAWGEADDGLGVRAAAGGDGRARGEVDGRSGARAAVGGDGHMRADASADSRARTHAEAGTDAGIRATAALDAADQDAAALDSAALNAADRDTADRDTAPEAGAPADTDAEHPSQAADGHPPQATDEHPAQATDEHPAQAAGGHRPRAADERRTHDTGEDSSQAGEKPWPQVAGEHQVPAVEDERVRAVAEAGVRPRAVVVATRLPVRLAAEGGWGATTLTLPAGTWRDLLTGALFTGRIPLAHLLGQYPVSLLERHDL
ncbi:(1-_4)-alpha-D-glucan 1-alpha-D-glucosylmutase [Nonomuraea thailandensis]|uniref:(1->4)-alpha-D-glucan 1-alpha-D-glucosylmutase n=1 Tax=Nonomuraea thailandensis TaxID=1188745 RepID=A0A9X2GTE2_9ACTN|nr:malto-oligosyltrehalose synthase [Nonomuraea thailandensis]MCP2361426.1 (1->4)-alpha-D-glucan 1-alpha-D-glucosylmutase [Nonomuraea thailandensis]